MRVSNVCFFSHSTQDADTDEKKLAIEMANAFIETKLPENVFGAPKAAAGMWASALRVLDPVSKEMKATIDFEQNEAAFSVGLVRFASQPGGRQFLLVGVAKDLRLNPRECSAGYIYCYEVFVTRFCDTFLFSIGECGACERDLISTRV